VICRSCHRETPYAVCLTHDDRESDLYCPACAARATVSQYVDDLRWSLRVRATSRIRAGRARMPEDPLESRGAA
jgi:hypothetical protein